MITFPRQNVIGMNPGVAHAHALLFWFKHLLTGITIDFVQVTSAKTMSKLIRQQTPKHHGVKNVRRYFTSKNQTNLNNIRIILSKIMNLNNYFLNFVFSHQILSFLQKNHKSCCLVLFLNC